MQISENWFLKPKSITELVNLLKKASLLEVSSESKPGNVSPFQSIGDMTYSNFCSAINAIASTTEKYLFEENQAISLGELIFNQVKAMMASQSAGNLLLGHILLGAPLIFASNKIISTKTYKTCNWNLFWNKVESEIRSASVMDAIWIARAINMARAGGLKNPGGKPLDSKYDLTTPDIEQILMQDRISFRDIFKESTSYDMISNEICNNFQFTRQILVKWAIPNIYLYEKSSDFISDLFLTILAKKPDSLIYRKNSQEIAESIQKQAISILKVGSILDPRGKKLIAQFNQKLLASNGKLNPGTTADLTFCVLFIGLLFNQLGFLLK